MTNPWLADVTLSNGGRFVLAIDSAAGRGEFRPVDNNKHGTEVIAGVMSLFPTIP